MTKEELEKEANKFADENATPDLDCSFRVDIFEASKEGYLAGAEPREKRIAELEDKLANADYQLEGRDNEIRELKAQIEKMKWHKIADGDIPKVTGDYITNIGVLTYDYYGNNIYKWHTPFCEACDYGDEVDDDEVIAWCEIPKYTKEIKENGNTEV